MRCRTPLSGGGSKAKQFPDDTRNLRAAEELERLAAQIEQLEGSAIHERVRALYDRVQRQTANGSGSTFMRTYPPSFEPIGFHNGYATGEQFLEWYCGRLEEGIGASLRASFRRSMTPFLHRTFSEQAANDPAVKAAKQAYDEAFAKAYAEARQKNM